jgi:hypothetical protein
MNKKLSLVAIILLVCTAINAKDADRTYDIKFNVKDRKGDTYSVSRTSTETLELVLKKNGEVANTKSEKNVYELDSILEVLEVGTTYSVSFTINRFLKNAGPVVEKGTVIVVTRADNSLKYAIKGTPVEDQALIKIFNDVLSVSKYDADDDQAFGTPDRKKIGDSWKVKPEQIVEQLKNYEIILTPENVNGTITLAGVEKKQGKECLKINISILFKNPSFPFDNVLPKGNRMLKGELSMDYRMYMPVDHSVAAPESDFHFTFDYVSKKEKDEKDGTEYLLDVKAVLDTTTKLKKLR